MDFSVHVSNFILQSTNEFLIYHEQISTTEQDPNKLLAMIIYKNVFPRDFSQLQLNRGYVHALFDQKEKFIENERQRLRAQIVQINDALTAAENEHLRDVREVNQIYDPQIREQQRYYSHQNEVEALEKDRDARLDHLKNREIKQKETLKKKIQKLENEIADLQHSKLHELIAKHKSLEIFKVTSVNEIGKELNFNEIKGSDYFLLIKYLIRYGYIDESYPDYMTYFYENSLSRTDKIFLRSVTDEDAKECDYPLKSPETVAARLNPEHFDKEETLNFDLFVNCKCKLNTPRQIVPIN